MTDMDNDARQRTLEEIREAIRANDDLRLDPSLSEDGREDLEKTPLILRDMERELVSEVSGNIVGRLEAAAAPLKEIAAGVRGKVTAMNEPAKVLEYVKDLMSLIAGIMKEAGRWR